MRGRVEGSAAVALGFALFCFVVVRAASLSITHDEALTYFWHVTGPWSRIVLFRTPGLPDNNHVLFTLLAKASTCIFGVSELALRLPSLAGYVLFLLGLCRLLGVLVAGWWWRVLGFGVIASNPYLVDFFSLAR